MGCSAMFGWKDQGLAKRRPFARWSFQCTAIFVDFWYFCFGCYCKFIFGHTTAGFWCAFADVSCSGNGATMCHWIIQWAFQEPKKLEVPIPYNYKAYFLGLCKGISQKNMAFIWYSTSISGSWNSHWIMEQTPDDRISATALAAAVRASSRHPSPVPSSRWRKCSVARQASENLKRPVIFHSGGEVPVKTNGNSTETNGLGIKKTHCHSMVYHHFPAIWLS